MRKIACFIALLLVDQLSKSLLFQYLALHQKWPLLPGLSLFCCQNKGVAWSLGSQWPGAILLLNCLLLVVFSRLLWQKPSWAWVLVLAGGLGNTIDRLAYGAVRDFILLSWGSWSWPVFNLADSYLTLGGVLIFFDFFFATYPTQPSAEELTL